jgi:hypothetical protein
VCCAHLQPGCYPGDDGSSDVADRYNFFAHRKRFLVSCRQQHGVDHQDAVDSRVASIALLLVPLVLAVLAGLLPGEQSLPAGADLVHHMEALRPVHPLLDPGQLHYPRDS